MTIEFFFTLLWIVTGVVGFGVGLGAVAATRRRLQEPSVLSPSTKNVSLPVG